MNTADAELLHLAELIDGLGIAMLATRTEDGLVSRPVATLRGGSLTELWFFTSAASHKATELATWPQVNLAFADVQRNRFVSVSGHASFERDRRRYESLWREDMRAYFPGGRDDPDLRLVRVQMETAEYWEGPASAVGKALSFALAAISGDADQLGDNRTLALEDGAALVVRGNTRGDAGRAEHGG